jgi:hypothetical protein
MWIETVVRLPPEDSGLQHCIIRLHNSWVDSKRIDKRRFFRREPVVIINPETGDKVMRYVMGSAGLPGVGRTSVALDYDAVDSLNIKFKEPVRLEVRRARMHEVYLWFWNHQDLSVRHSLRLGLIGAGLGVLGFLVGTVPLLF